MSDDPRYIEAQRRVRARREFQQHLAVYLVINTMLFLLNFFTMPGRWWFYWPLFGWGIGVTAHAVALYFTLRQGGEVEEKAIRREMEKHAHA
ncbi:MAG: 2TM domain-containing protein [Gemmatimonadaceae bacterium]|nr:2TM domain-containing protein [Gemmatimonadaceae bacterium]NUR56310.1 2TM domain-containing protein [Acidobacteriota bacterium]